MFSDSANLKMGFPGSVLKEFIWGWEQNVQRLPGVPGECVQLRLVTFFRTLFASGSTLTHGDDADEETQEAQTPARAANSMKTFKILVVEDEGIVALHIRMTLKRMGHQVIATVDTGKEAIAVAIEAGPDLILMDIRLKGNMDGIEAVHAIQQQCAIPIIYLTGQLDEATVKRAQPTNPIGYLAKPFIVSEMSTLIQKVIDKKDLRQPNQTSERN